MFFSVSILYEHCLFDYFISGLELKPTGGNEKTTETIVVRS